jgi:hypothetical protein
MKTKFTSKKTSTETILEEVIHLFMIQNKNQLHGEEKVL